MAEPEDMIIPMLREIRVELGDLRREVRDGFAANDRRFSDVEVRLKNLNNAMTADTMMSKLVTGDFEERIGALEKKVDDLMNRS
ncbi:hypothetical protein DFR52_101595 [Hoeflea marina]|uniref:Uncharacterized protein n=1 Tax=Hoeflea marina TaxID=274592 RepID=A0A317PUI1_9HYPH|nr:hypothetical protein [Hoeflea marina]PWW03906.1 hypothetical protein DFR52_101595 [Hoeflea marina]